MPRPRPERAPGTAPPGGGRVLLAWLLGLPEATPPWDVTALRVRADAVEAAVGPAGGAHTLLRIEARGARREGLVATTSLVLHYRGEGLPDAVADAIVGIAPARLGDRTLAELAAAVAGESQPSRVAALFPEEAPGSHGGGLLDSWGGDGWADFFAGAEIARAQLDSLDLLSGFVFLQHGDAECMHAGPTGVAATEWFVSYPWDDRRRPRRAGQTAGEATGLSADTVLSTDLDEDDVIMGGSDKLRRALVHACSLACSRSTTLLVSNTCVPTVVGEDPEVETRRQARTAGCPALFLTVTPQAMDHLFEDLLVGRRLEAEAGTAPAPGRLVNLVGFPPRPDVDELEGCLGRLGVEVNVRLLPCLRREFVDRLPRAGLNVLYPNRTWQHLVEQLGRGSRLGCVSPPAPYGMAGTARWLATVAAAAGADTAAPPEPEPALLAEWAALRAEASGRTLAVVARDSELFYLTEPAATWGVSLLEVLEEMGFALEVLVKVEDARQGRAAASRIVRCLEVPQRHVVRGFDTPSRLRERLDASPAEAVFSSHTFDWRATRTGKATFSLQHFEMGFEGAIRTLRRLLAVCRTPLYRRFRAALGGWPEIATPGAR